ncbi:MAG: hypothetical protein IJ815_02710 [Lachnospiraceae bacterium]|nr:hypothetical protein [Lachnospiraceae bacterium]
MLVFADKIIDNELGDKVKGWIKMTKVGRLFEAEKEAALAEKDVLLAEKDAIIASVQLESAKAQAESAKAQAENAKAIARIKELEAQLAALGK